MSEEAQSAEDPRPDFLVGDVVCLRSPSPRMTVEALPDSGLVECIWFNADTPHRGTFRREILRNIGLEQEIERKLALDTWRAMQEQNRAKYEEQIETAGGRPRSWSWTGR